jgi:hypothetical protein
LIGWEWKQLARTLKFGPTDIQAIEYDNRLSLKEQIHQLFVQWEKAQGRNATSKALLEGLVEANLVLEPLQERGLIQHGMRA